MHPRLKKTMCKVLQIFLGNDEKSMGVAEGGEYKKLKLSRILKRVQPNPLNFTDLKSVLEKL